MRRWPPLRTGLLVTAVALYLIAWNRGIALLYGLFALVVAVLVIGHLAPWWNLRGLSVAREHPLSATEGDILRLRLTCRTAPRRMPRYMLCVYDRVPCAENPEPMVFLPRLRGSRAVDYGVRCVRRGVHAVGPLRVETGYPLGLHRRVQWPPDTESEVLVYPATFPVGVFPWPGGNARPSTGDHLAARQGGTDAFMGTRDYRRGDSPRHIHWPSTARRDELMVREFESSTRVDVCLLLDCHASSLAGNGHDSSFEYAVRIAASVGLCAVELGHAVRLLGFGRQTMDVKMGQGSRQKARLLDALARIEADGPVRYRQAVARAMAGIVPGTVLVLFETVGVRGAGESGVGDRDLAGTYPVWIRFDRGSFEGAGAADEHGRQRHVDGYLIRRGDDLERVFAG